MIKVLEAAAVDLDEKERRACKIICCKKDPSLTKEELMEHLKLNFN